MHIEDLKKIADYKKQLTDIRMPAFLLLNISTLFAGGIGFGRPFAAIIISFLGLIVMAVESRPFPGLVEWTEKLTVILSSMSVVAEYFIIGIKHWLKTNNKKKLLFFGQIFFVCAVIFSCYFYRRFNL
jgi:hypothetical protein